MKKLELELKKRLLIWESDFVPDFNGRHIELICKGSELTEEVLKTIVDFFEHEEEVLNDWYKGKICINKQNVYRDYKVEGFTYNALESFISAIEAQGYYWGENQIKHPDNIVIQPASLNWWYEQEKSYLEAESKTFNPEKTLIFEIL